MSALASLLFFAYPPLKRICCADASSFPAMMAYRSCRACNPESYEVVIDGADCSACEGDGAGGVEGERTRVTKGNEGKKWEDDGG